ncbi:hypothetical protein V6N13_113867 [Hibiscus sabdariffa]
MAPRKVFERNKRTQSICKDRRTIQEPQIVFDGSNQTQEAETEQVLGELNRTQEHELQQVHNAPNQTHDDINPDITVDNSAKLSSEIGIISRQFTPIPTKWKDMKDNYKFHALERLKSKFEMKLDDDYVKTSVMSIMSKLSRNHRHQEKMVELQSTPVEEGAEPKTIDNIVDEVLGTRSGSWTDEEFAKRWWKILDRFELKDDEWMKSLYEDRKMWVPTYIMNVLLAGMSMVQGSESVNSFFDKYVHKKSTVQDFLRHYEAILQDKHEEEAKANSDS